MSPSIKPQPGNLQMLERDAVLYKIIPAEYFLDEFKKGYLYFQRVDLYKDIKDSMIPEMVRNKLKEMKYEKNPDFNEEERFVRQRPRTYSCCFSTENTPYIRKEYGRDKNAICVVFDCHKLVEFFEKMISESRIVLNNSRVLHNFLHLNYGLVNYIEHDNWEGCLTNPIETAYLKDVSLSKDSEFRITLAAEGLYNKYVLSDDSEFDFPKSIQIKFDFQKATSEQVIQSIEIYKGINVEILDEIKSLFRNIKFVKK